MENHALAEQMIQLCLDHFKATCRLSEAVALQGEDGALLCLRACERPMLSGELVERLGLTTGRVANILRQLEDKGLVRRVQDLGDRRRVHVSLTDEGAARADERYAALVRAHQRLLDGLGEADSREAVRLMRRCLAYYQAAK